jgi:HAD superfamily hydrolase (TIGR01509 family)
MAAIAVAWDMDGTLLDSAAAVNAAFTAALQRLGGPDLTAAQVVAAYPLGPPEVILAHLAGRPVTPAETEEYYRELQGASVHPYAEVAEVLGTLRARGQPVAVFTGASRRAAAILLTAAGLTVDVLVSGDQVRAKPAPDGLVLTARLIGIDPRDLAYIGDSPADLGAAKAAGCQAVAAAWGHMYDPAELADSVLGRPGQALALLA